MGNLRDAPLGELWKSPQAKFVRRSIQDTGCKCLLTCELAHNLKYSIPYHLRRLRELFPRYRRRKPDAEQEDASAAE